MLKVIVSSANKSKINSVKVAFNKLNIVDYEIKNIHMKSSVSNQPINEETIQGAKNRNAKLLEYCNQNAIDYDILISIEGGFEQVDDNYYIVTYAAVYKTSNKKEIIGKSQGLPISKKMFEYVKNGNDLNKVIEKIMETKNNRKNSGISGFLTNGFYYRSYFDASAIVSAFQRLLNNKYYRMLDKEL